MLPTLGSLRRLCLSFPLLFFLSSLGQPPLLAEKPAIEPPVLLKEIQAKRCVYYAENSDYFRYEKDGQQRQETVHGQYWRFYYDWKSKQEGHRTIVDRLKSLNANFLRLGKSKILATIDEDANRRLWIYYELFESDCTVYIMRQLHLSLGQSLKVTFEKGKLPAASIKVNCRGTHFLALKTTIADQELDLQAVYDKKYGSASRRINWGRKLFPAHGKFHLVADFPQVKGSLLFKARPYSVSKKQEVSFTLESLAPLSCSDGGKELGGLQVRLIPYGNVEVLPEFNDIHDHPSFSRQSLKADRQPNGDAIFWLPPGMWTVRVRSADYPNINYVDSHLIQVKPRRVTLVDMPRYLAALLAPDDSGRIEIRKPNLLAADINEGQKASIQMNLLGVSDSTIRPSPDNVSIFEGKQEGKVLTVDTVTTALDLILLLDSSGSMKGSMAKALAATRRFIKETPEDTRATIVDFDTKPKILAGKSRAELLAALAKVRANGATALYDSIILGLDKLAGKKRPALVVFTDGVDANWNDTKPGSVATKSQVFTKAQAAKVPIFTIGFGKRPDVDTLTRLAEISGGNYYNALDKDSLDKVFAAIRQNLARQFLVTYERPKHPEVSDVPVLSLVVDNSGSMDLPPSREGCDYRIEKVRQTLSDFVKALPQGYLMQLLTFSSDCRLNQTLTDDKAKMLRSLSLMKGDGGTNILDSVKAAYDTLKTIPSSNRTLVFVADAALTVAAKNKMEFETLLGKLKDANIKTLWVGIVEKDEGKAFARAASLSGGDKVVSKDLSQLPKLFTRLGKRLQGNKAASKGTTIRAFLRNRSPVGKNNVLTASVDALFPTGVKKEEILSPEALRCSLGPSLTVYDSQLSSFLSGGCALVKDVRVTKRIPLQIEGKNKALKMQLGEAIFLTRLRGVEPPERKRFLALTMSLENIAPKQKLAVYDDGSAHPASWVGGGEKAATKFEFKKPTYVVPDVKRHIFLRWNNEASIAASEATWLAERPLILPNKNGISVAPEQPVSGTLVFLVPNEHMKQSSIHFFDEDYGHIDLPITGVMTYDKQVYAPLPKSVSEKLSSSFQLKLNSFNDFETLNGVQAANDCIFRVIEGTLQSNVQANLLLSPYERISFAIPTHRGDLSIPLSEHTDNIPMGYYRSTTFTPGSKSTIRFVFQLPKVLAKSKEKGTLLVDLADKTIALPLGAKSAGPKVTSEKSKSTVSAQGLTVNVLEFGHGSSYGLLIFEVSLQDEKDNNNTSLRGLFKLCGHNVELLPLAASEEYLFGLDERSFVLDGRKRRGILVFQLPTDKPRQGWRLRSSVFTDLNLLYEKMPYVNKTMVTPMLKGGQRDDYYAKSLLKALKQLAKRRKSLGFSRVGALNAPVAKIGDDEKPKMPVAVPSLSSIGALKVASLKSYDELLSLLRSLQWRPGNRYAWFGRYAPEAVLTQGWGTETDLARLAQSALTRLGIESDCLSLPLTEKGKEKLPGFEEVPALRYVHEERHEILVFPFVQFIEELKPLVKFEPPGDTCSDRTASARFTLHVHLEAKASAAHASKADAASSLTGSSAASGKRRKTILSAPLKFTDLSKGAIDIGFTETAKNGHPYLRAVLDGPAGRIFSNDDEAVSLKKWRVVGEELVIDYDGKDVRRRWTLGPDDELTARFHTIGVNLPSLPAGARKALGRARVAAHQNAKNPDGLSALRWYSRGVIARFIAAQTMHDRKVAKKFGLSIGRSKEPRILTVTLSRQDGENMTAELDLMNVSNQVHVHPFLKAKKLDKEEQQKALRSFNIITGLMNARLEASAIPGGKGCFDLWQQAGLTNEFIIITNENRGEYLDLFRTRKFPQKLIQHITNTYNIVLFPAKPTMSDGQPRWAWLEVNPQSYETKSFLDSGARGAILDDLIGNLLADELQYIIGRMKGVEAAVWAVSAFSLKLDDYEEIKKQAQIFLKGVAGGMSYDVAGTSTSTKPGADKNVKISFSPGSSSYGEVGPVKFNLFGNPVSVKPHDSVAGFNNGFKSGVDYYFKKVAQ